MLSTSAVAIHLLKHFFTGDDSEKGGIARLLMKMGHVVVMLVMHVGSGGLRGAAAGA